MSEPDPFGDERDPRLAELLRVPPLDDLTRARLVRGALERADAPATGTARRRAFGAGAAVVVLVAVGASIVGLWSGGKPRPMAERVLDRSHALEAGPEAAAEPSRDPADVGTVAVPALGDLGEVTRPRELRAAVADARPAGRAPLATCAFMAARPFGTVVAAGRGTVANRPVDVLVVEPPGGGRLAVVVDAACRATKPVPL